MQQHEKTSLFFCGSSKIHRKGEPESPGSIHIIIYSITRRSITEVRQEHKKHRAHTHSRYVDTHQRSTSQRSLPSAAAAALAAGAAPAVASAARHPHGIDSETTKSTRGVRSFPLGNQSVTDEQQEGRRCNAPAPTGRPHLKAPERHGWRPSGRPRGAGPDRRRDVGPPLRCGSGGEVTLLPPWLLIDCTALRWPARPSDADKGGSEGASTRTV
jgi:hypothetical protein